MAVCALAGAGAVAAVATAPAAAADGPTTFNGGVVAIVPSMSPDWDGSAVPYPSSTTVTGMTGTVTHVTLALDGVVLEEVHHLSAMLVAPNGANLVIMADAGSGPVEDATFTFDDAAAASVPIGVVTTGTYKPTNASNGGKLFPSPAPTPSSATTFAGAFDGVAANGNWQLYVAETADSSETGIIRGWSLTITTAGAAVTTTKVTSSLNPSMLGQPVTFTAAVAAGGNPVTQGTVTFTEGSTVLAPNVAVNAAGQATFTTSALQLGIHPITATYAGLPAFAGSSGSVTQQVEMQRTLTTLKTSKEALLPDGSATFTATITAGGSPIGAGGDVTFSIDGNEVADVSVDENGQAAFTWKFPDSGNFDVQAIFNGDLEHGPSAADLTEIVIVASPPAPSPVDEGGSLTLAVGAPVSGASYTWDVNGDGDFSDASGPNATLTWRQLEALGINDGPATYPVALRTTINGDSVTGTASLKITNAAPTTALNGDSTATAGESYRLGLGADDPSSADQAAGFHYTVDWGDGDAAETLDGAGLAAADHTYAKTGSFTVTVTATDKDGATSSPVTTTVSVHATASSALAATGFDGGRIGLLGTVLTLGGLVLVVVARRRQRA